MINVVDKSNCSGCKACFNICPNNCIEMLTDEEGFWYPKVDDKCIQCGLCVKVCPEINIYHKDKSYERPICHAAWNKNENIRAGSSSGGVFTSIAQWILLNGGVVFGAGYDKELKVVHKEVCELEGLKDLRGSKYVQSDINNTFEKAKQHLEMGRKVLFTGTPCQIAGLYSFLQKEYEKLYTADIVCHGVPSPMVFKKYKQNMELKYNSNIKSIAFRDKKTGWKKYSVSMHFNNKEEYSTPFAKDVFMLGFLRNYYLRPSCYKCSYAKIPRVSDITLGDYWGISSKYPELDDNKGTSLLLVNSSKGKELLRACVYDIFTSVCDLDHAVQGNPSIVSSVKVPKLREKFFNDLNSLDFDYVIKKYMSEPTWLDTKIVFGKRVFRYIKRRIKELLKNRYKKNYKGRNKHEKDCYINNK